MHNPEKKDKTISAIAAGVTQASHCVFVGRADGMEHGCALLCEALFYKRCRHLGSPLCTPFALHRSAIAV
jgi:hypothetical protein